MGSTRGGYQGVVASPAFWTAHRDVQERLEVPKAHTRTKKLNENIMFHCKVNAPSDNEDFDAISAWFVYDPRLLSKLTNGCRY